MTKYPQPHSAVIRVRVPVATSKALHATGAPVSQTIRLAIDYFLAHPSVKSNPQASDKKASAS